MFTVTKNFLDHFGATPVAALSLFLESFVELKPGQENGYSIIHGVPTIKVACFGSNSDAALFHELGHFNAIPEERLLKKNFGFKNPSAMYGRMTGYGDILHELKVVALEWNLMDYFGYKPEKSGTNYTDWLIYSIPGIKNFAHTYKLNSKEKLQKALRKRFLAHTQEEEYTYYGFLKRWKKRNAFLRKTFC